MKHYRKKQVIVQAMQLTLENSEEVSDWCGGLVVEEIDPTDDKKRYVGVNIPTLEGVIRASEGDCVVKEARAGFRIYKAGEFLDTFEAV